MAGIPPTAGFLGKYYLFSAAVRVDEILLAVLAVMASLVGAYVYLRPLVYMFMKDPTKELVIQRQRGAWCTAFITAILTLQMGMMPGTLFERVVTMIAQVRAQLQI